MVALYWALGASAGVHVLGGLASLSLAHPPPSDSRAAADAVELVWVEPVAAREPPPRVVVSPPPREEPPALRVRPPPRARRSRAEVVVPAEIGAPVVVIPAPVSEPPASPPRRAPPDLDPRAVALSGFAPEGAGSAEDAPPDRGRALGEALAEGLAAEANAPPHVRRRRPPPELRRRSDGSYVYRGHVFAARIAPDGTVSFSDRRRVNAEGWDPGRGTTAGTFRFDLMDGRRAATRQRPLLRRAPLVPRPHRGAPRAPRPPRRGRARWSGSPSCCGGG